MCCDISIYVIVMCMNMVGNIHHSTMMTVLPSYRYYPTHKHTVHIHRSLLETSGKQTGANPIQIQYNLFGQQINIYSRVKYKQQAQHEVGWDRQNSFSTPSSLLHFLLYVFIFLNPHPQLLSFLLKEMQKGVGVVISFRVPGYLTGRWQHLELRGNFAHIHVHF